MVQTSRHPGMSEILTELLSFKGNEVYVETVPGCVGMSLEQVNLRLPRSTAIGVVRNGEHMLNPDAGFTVQAGDQLVVLAEDDNMTSLQQPAVPNDSLFQADRVEEAPEPDTLLVFGYSDMLKQILMEQDVQAAPGSKAIIAVEPGKVDFDTLPTKADLANIELDVRECKLYSRQVIESLVAEGPTGILLMSDPDLPDEEADARTIMLQLHLNDIASEIGSDVPLTIEMNNTRNQRLSQMMRATDFVVSSRITAKMMAQVAEDRYKKAILNDLLSDGGSSIYMKPVKRYVRCDQPVDFYTLGAAASRFGEIAIGYKRNNPDGSFDIQVNPRSKEPLTFDADDDLIVVARR